MKQKIVVRSLIAAGVIAVGAGVAAKYDPSVFPQALAEGNYATAVRTSAQPAPAMALPDFSGIVAQYGPAVVNVSVIEKAEKVAYAPAMPQLDPNNPFYQFFRQFQGQTPHPETPTHALGSGFIVSPDGIILTNAHVVNGAANVTVKLTDGREFHAKVIGMDKPSDIAVLKIDAKNLPTVKLDRANDVKVGQWVVAIGAPFGFENSATAGIVSAKSRTLPGDTYVPFLQTDVAVNPGNSGGPLFNAKGEVVGINSQIYSSDGGYEGLSFAIPIKVALNVENQLLQHGSVTRGRLGVGIQDVNQGLADSFGLKAPGGALVSSVEKDSPAAKAGLKDGDVILRYDGKDIATSSQLPLLIANTAPGTVARLQVMRKGETRQIDVTVGRLNDVKLASADVNGHSQGRLGVVVRPLTAGEQQQAGVSGGLIVENAAGPAANAGIQPGDMILSFNDTPIKSREQFKQLLAKAGKHVALLVQRDNKTIYVPVDLG
ncbi:MAG TPA: Do family serine endopeptidase [Rhodocyclaceae bacterium]|nr:Do family serine endopeptidase [Rhodocyclaceae bacterium]